ncbi:hypothetical protein [Streptomyces sp. SID161]|uniref:hypothetical protein n=1 Tax=Streptomyces sp. SID161 TaxID=2690251 RepID=UPI0013F98A60|nr:hypothetical protein [Streptomyces sp. SID161]MYW46960.1 hypothetical protein [Streptomyces sp. SID161]
MEKQRSRCPRPPGAPRWVAMFHEDAQDTWTVGAESLYREPVLYAVGDMAQTVRARGEAVTVAVWGPEDGAWRLFDSPSAAVSAPATGSAPAAGSAPATGSAPAAAAEGPAPERAAEERAAPERAVPAGPERPEPGPSGPDRLAARMTGRRHQVLLAGLSRAGLYDLTDEDGEAVRTLAEQLDEPTVRRVAHWLSVAGGGG